MGKDRFETKIPKVLSVLYTQIARDCECTTRDLFPIEIACLEAFPLCDDVRVDPIFEVDALPDPLCGSRLPAAIRAS